MKKKRTSNGPLFFFLFRAPEVSPGTTKCSIICPRPKQIGKRVNHIVRKKAQRLTGGSGKVTSEGFSKPIPVEYPIAKWAEDMADYMRSCMSYTGCRTIQELRENTKLIINGSGKNSYWK